MMLPNRQIKCHGLGEENYRYVESPFIKPLLFASHGWKCFNNYQSSFSSQLWGIGISFLILTEYVCPESSFQITWTITDMCENLFLMSVKHWNDSQQMEVKCFHQIIILLIHHSPFGWVKQNTVDWAASKQQKFIFQSSVGWIVKDQKSRGFGVLWEPFTVLKAAILGTMSSIGRRINPLGSLTEGH